MNTKKLCKKNVKNADCRHFCGIIDIQRNRAMLVTSSALITNQKGIDYMSKYNTNNKRYKAMCEKVGKDFREWLIEKYWDEKMTSRQIAKIAYGNPKNSPNITNWMAKLGVERRSRSEAVALQWVDNDERRAWQSNFAKENLSGGTPAREALIKVMQTKEYKEKSASAKLGRNNPMYGVTGDKHPQWNPELSDSERITKRNYPEYIAWRTSVFERDGYACQVCLDEVGGNLTTHHINGYHWDEGGRTDINNGIALCDSCHKEFHSMYGYKDVNLFQFSQFLEYKQQALNI